MDNFDEKNCNEIVELLAKDYRSKYENNLKQKITSISEDFNSRHLFYSTARISTEFQAEFEYIDKLIDYVIESLENKYSLIPIEKCKTKLHNIVNIEYQRLIPKATSRLVQANLSLKGTAKNYEKAIRDKMKKSCEKIETKCALEQKRRVAFQEKESDINLTQRLSLKTAKIKLIAAIIALITAILTSPLWLPFIKGILISSNRNTDSAITSKKNSNTTSKIINETGPTPLYARTKQRIDEFKNKLIKEQIMPWGLIPTGKPIEIKYYDGQIMHFEGIQFSGSPRKVFWGNYIEPFLKNGIIEMLDATANECRKNGLDPKSYLNETGLLLESMICSVYENMVEKDQRLTGDKNRKDVSNEISLMKQFLEEQKIAAFHLFSEADRKNAISETVDQNNTQIQPEEKVESKSFYESGAALLEIFKADSFNTIPALPVFRTYWNRELTYKGGFLIPERVLEVGQGARYVARFFFYYEAKEKGKYGFSVAHYEENSCKLVIGGVKIFHSIGRIENGESYSVLKRSNKSAQGVCNLEKGFHRFEFYIFAEIYNLYRVDGEKSSNTDYNYQKAAFQLKVLTPDGFDAVPITKDMMLLKKE